MVLGTDKRETVSAVGKHSEGGFFADELLFDDDTITRFSECPVYQDRCDGLQRLFEGASGDNAFACCKSIRLNENRGIAIFDISHGFFGIRKCLVFGCRDSVFYHELLSEIFTRFQVCCAFVRPKCLQSAFIKHVNDPFSQGCFGPHNG